MDRKELISKAKQLQQALVTKELIKDRTYNLKKYKQCFVGKECISVIIALKLVSVKEDANRRDSVNESSQLIIQNETNAIRFGQQLIANKIIKHVTNEHGFKNDNLFYEFVENYDNEIEEEKTESMNNIGLKQIIKQYKRMESAVDDLSQRLQLSKTICSNIIKEICENDKNIKLINDDDKDIESLLDDFNEDELKDMKGRLATPSPRGTNSGDDANETARRAEAKEEAKEGALRQIKKKSQRWKTYDSAVGLLNEVGDYNLSKGLESKRSEDEIFDAHLHVNDHFGDTDGPLAMFECLKDCRVFGAAMCMNQYVKKWGEFELEKPETVYYDQYPMSCVLYGDYLLWSLFHSDVDDFMAKYNLVLLPMMNSFDLTDRNCVNALNRKYKLTGTWFKGIGQLNFRRGDITNLIHPRPTINSVISKEFFKRVDDLNFPVVFQSNATSMSTKGYAEGYEYIPEIVATLTEHPTVPFLWIDFGITDRGYYDANYYYGDDSLLNTLLDKFPNLFCSITVNALNNEKVDQKNLAEVVKKYKTRFMVGTTIIGKFDKQNSQKYKDEIKTIREFLAKIDDASVCKLVCSENAVNFYNNPDKVIKGKINEKIKIDAGLRDELQSKLTYNDVKFVELEAENKEDDLKYNIIDCHLHLLDFLHKSSGTESALKAMDNCGVSKAVLFGMPCCKKWCKNEPQRPLYYQDDNGECYFYSFADQMVADAWLALDNKSRQRFAPCIASFNPTDKHAIDHIKRMYDKYPNLWRGIGEVMCRHDDLSALLQEFEAPVVNHPAMDAVYEFCIEKDLPVLVHHNSDRVADDNGIESNWQYTHEVEEVLQKYPKLRFIWVHAGVSRRVHEPDHYREIDRLLKKYKNLKIDISWVVWEDVICDEKGEPKPEWIKMIERHNQRVFLGSDQVGQFITIDGKNIYKKEILKYYKLLQKLSKEAAENVAFRNAEREYFDNWKCPLDQAQIKPIYPCEYLHHQSGYFLQKGEQKF